MRDFSQIYKRLRYLMLEKLPEYIDKINKEKNDGLILKPFTNKEVIQGNLKTPFFTLTYDESEQGVKDRIIELIQYKFVIELSLDNNSKDQITEFCRYTDAIINMLEEDDFEYWHFHKFKTVGTKKLILTVCVEW